MYLFIEKGLRAGISYGCKRHSEANNKYIKHYDLTKPSKCISYLDVNNLYRWGMSGYLPYGGFMCLKYVDNFDLNWISENGPIGYIFEVSKNSPIGYVFEADLEYSKKLHELHNYYPLAPEKLTISYKMLSDYCKKIANEYGIKFGDVKKLIPNLGDKTDYVVY